MPARVPTAHIAVLGLMGAGKTTLGRALADRLGIPYYDSDRELELSNGRTGRELVTERGVEGLHQLEAAVVADLLTRQPPLVFSAAASAVDSAELRRRLASSVFCCWVDVPVEVTASRLQAESHRRPAELAELRELAQRRKPWFRELADVTINGTLPLDVQLETVAGALAGWMPA